MASPAAEASPTRVAAPRRRRRIVRRQVPRQWRTRLAPRPPKPRRLKGAVGAWTIARRVLWSRWIWAAGCVGALVSDAWWWAGGTGAVAAIAHVLAPQETPPRYGLDHEFPVAAPEFRDSLVGVTGAPLLAGNRVELLNNGDEFYPSMKRAIVEAQASVTIEAYIYWAGEVGLQFAQALAACAERGLPVKILLDAVGSATIGDDILRVLERGGCQLAWYNPVRWYAVGRFNHRTHRKSLIVDGRVGFTGGAGIADHWRGRARGPDEWRDMQVRIEGPGVIPLQTGFAQNWLQATGELISGAEFFPESVPVGDVSVQTLLSSPATGMSNARALYYFAIVCARKSLLIANPYFVPDQAAVDTLVEARQRGVEVKVMIAGRHIDNWLARRNSVRLLGDLLCCGIEVYEYDLTMLHHKVMIVDQQWATIGTTNFDSRSFAFNEENNVSFTDPTLVQELERTFRADLAACSRVTLEGWRRRGLGTRIQEVVASLLQDQV